MDWKEYFKQGADLVISTASKDGVPNANVVTSHGYIGDRLLIGNCQMTTTLNNLKENPQICIVGGDYCRLKGHVEIFDSGENMDIDKVRNHDTTAPGDYEWPTRNAILITVDEVYSLSDGTVIK